MEFIGECITDKYIHQSINISVSGLSSSVTIWNTTKSFPLVKIYFRCYFAGNDLIMSDGDSTIFVLVDVKNNSSINGYYVLLGKKFGQFKVTHHISAHSKL
jgi:hypothetical protein